MLIAALLLVSAAVGWVTKLEKRCVKKKNGLSSVEGAIFSGRDAKKARSASPDIKVEVTASKAVSGAISILKPRDESLSRAPCHCASVKASGRVITVTILPTFNAIRCRLSSAAGPPWRWGALAAIA